MTNPRKPDFALKVRVGTAGWSIRRQYCALGPVGGSHLERYSLRLSCAEINSSFHRSHRSSTYARWAMSTPADFRFSVKAPRAITHDCALSPTLGQMATFLTEVGNLGDKLGPILFQLPPRQSFEEPAARAFFTLFRDLYPTGNAVLEPRHSAWFLPEAGHLLEEFHISRVIADPPRAAAVERPGGYPGLIYYRLHGSPRVYYSGYSVAWLNDLAKRIWTQHPTSEVWCIFDNTASGAALENAVTLISVLEGRTPES